MPSAHSNSAHEAVEAAIARVLAAERDALASVAQATHQADEIAEQARASARALAQRTDRRIRSVRAAFERALSERLEALHAEEARVAMRHEPSADELAALEQALRTLADELTGSPR